MNGASRPPRNRFLANGVAAGTLTLIEGDLYAWKLSRLGESAQVDATMFDLLFVLARLAPDFPLEAGSSTVRAITSRPMLREDEEIIRLTI